MYWHPTFNLLLSMDTAPVNFVDRVVELFDLNKTIAPVVASVANPVWKRILQLHHRNRRSLRIRLRSVDGGIECAFYECVPSLLIPIKEIESGGRRFVRISGVDLDDSVNSFPKHAKIILQNGEDLFKMMSQYIVDGSPPNFISYSRPPSTFQTTATENCLIDIQEKCAFFFICSDDYDRFNLVANFWVVGTSVPLCLHNPTP
ncbi:hypothetical protein QR680_014966 [Steinernema hermaphroditum]|uniref:Uncharacterized protein n=1 Tax=Steinernema hermaphroditum TaxID=289476 RepID=A0AA39IAM8_9BILA|nr:hypothetical protein QR680_014966 [Steinernema hermaphroditum]